jgi:hypothetical protein
VFVPLAAAICPCCIQQQDAGQSKLKQQKGESAMVQGMGVAETTKQQQDACLALLYQVCTSVRSGRWLRSQCWHTTACY